MREKFKVCMFRKMTINTESHAWLARKEEHARAIRFIKRKNGATQKNDIEFFEMLPHIKSFNERNQLKDLTWTTACLMEYAYFQGRRDELRDIRREEDGLFTFDETRNVCVPKREFGIDDVLKMYENMFEDERGLLYYSYMGKIHPEYTEEERMDKSKRLKKICEELDIFPIDFAKEEELGKTSKKFSAEFTETNKKESKEINE